jgi:hypothetical protein
MNRKKLIAALSAYKRPGTPVYAYHFRNLPKDVLQHDNAAALRAILRDDSLPARVREHAAGALGGLRDRRAVAMLIQALNSAELRRGAAVALGLIRDRHAAPALDAVAPRCKAARWALGQFDRSQSTDQLVADLRQCHLREIGRKLRMRHVPANQRRAIAKQALRELREAVRAGELRQEHRWLMNVLQDSDLPEVDDALAQALRLTVTNRRICPTVRGRLLRVIGARKPTVAMPALVEAACLTEDPAQAKMAIVCIERILRSRKVPAALGADARSRLQRQIEKLKRARTHTPPVKPLRSWECTPGSPRWFTALDRAIKALEGLENNVGDTKLPRTRETAMSPS